MATFATTPSMPPPPDVAGPGSAPSQPSSPMAASPAPAAPRPEVETASRQVIQAVQSLRAIAKAFPATSPEVSQVNDLIRVIQMKIMKSAQPGESAAPPVPSA